MLPRDPSRHVPANDLLQNAVATLLRRIPERWAEYDADELTATETQALFLLVAAGMVERRIRLRARLHNHPVAIEATITATGEYGFAEAMQPVFATMWTEWKDAFHAWQTGETRSAPFSITERLKPDEWRLTDQGALARSDLDVGNAQVALDFVLRRGFFDGEPRVILDPGCERVSGREPVRGFGKLVTMRKVQADASSHAEVNIGNWKEGADAFATAFQTMSKINGKKPENAAARAYTVAAIRQMTKLENATINRYAKLAKVRTPRRGERNFRYSVAETRAILETIIANTGEREVLTTCQAALQVLQETAE